jgi:hypothetical protein
MSRRRARHRLAGALIAAGLWLVAGRSAAAGAEAPSYVLTYAAPVVCPEEAVFLADVASHVHDVSRARGVRVNASIEERESGYAGVLVAVDASGTQSSRRIEGKKCADVAHALAFLAALVIELGGHAEPESPLPPNPAPAPAPPPPREPPAAVAPPRTFALSAVLLGGVRGGIGPVAHAGGDAGLEIGATGRLLAPSLRLVALVANGSLEGAGGSATLWLVGGRLEVCPILLGNARLAVRPCVGAELGIVHADGETAFAPRTATAPWVSAEATVRGQWFATDRWFVEVGGGPVMPLDRTRYYFEPDRTVFVVPGLTARAAIGVGRLF